LKIYSINTNNMKRKKRDFKRPLEFSLIMFASFILVIFLVQAASLPTPGGDSGVWGTKLNDYLKVEHKDTGVHSDVTADSIKINTLLNCDTLDTDGTGKILCGTDATGSGSADIPTGAVMAFNLASCPSGWTELTSARGRYIVGLPSGGTLAGTAGTALSNQENRPVGQHNHGITDPQHQHTVNAQATGATGGTEKPFRQSGTLNIAVTNFAATEITVNNEGSVAGTNAPYLQLLICQKD